VDEVADAVLALGEGTRLNLLFPVATHQAHHTHDGHPAKRTKRKVAMASQSEEEARRIRLTDLRNRGFNRLYQNAQVFEFSSPESLLDLDFAQPVFALVDRIVVAADQRGRIVDGIEIAYRESGEVMLETAPRDQKPERLRFAQRFECKRCHLRYEEP
jgi:excinuclease ABC subunit A